MLLLNISYCIGLLLCIIIIYYISRIIKNYQQEHIATVFIEYLKQTIIFDNQIIINKLYERDNLNAILTVMKDQFKYKFQIIIAKNSATSIIIEFVNDIDNIQIEYEILRIEIVKFLTTIQLYGIENINENIKKIKGEEENV